MRQPFAYMRKSYVRDMSTEMAPETQEREVRALAARHGDEIADEAMLSDWSVSGRKRYTMKRTGYLRLIIAIQQGDCSALYSYSLARLGRSVPDLSKLFELCTQHRVPIRLVADAVDTSTASARRLANILASVAQFEAEVASERLMAMYDTKRERAKAQGIDPRDAVRTSRRYGEERSVTDDDGSVRTLGQGEDGDMVLEVFRETGSYLRAARVLNAPAGEPVRMRDGRLIGVGRGLRPKSGKKWWASSVGVVIERLEPDVAARPKAQGSPRGGTEYVLARLLKCPVDGSTLGGQRVPDKKGKRWIRYACRHGESAPHERVSIAEHLILPAVEAEAARYWNPDESDGSPDKVAARREELIERRQRIVESRLDGLIDRSEAAQRAAAIDRELSGLDRPKPRDLRMWADLAPKEQNAVFRSLFERIELDPATFQPTTFACTNPEWRYPD